MLKLGGGGLRGNPSTSLSPSLPPPPPPPFSLLCLVNISTSYKKDTACTHCVFFMAVVCIYSYGCIFVFFLYLWLYFSKTVYVSLLQVMLMVASETGHMYMYATPKLQPMIMSEAGKSLIQTCLVTNLILFSTTPLIT